MSGSSFSAWRNGGNPAPSQIAAPTADARGHRRPRNGYVMIFGTLVLALILIPVFGLAIDVGLVYLAQTVMSTAADSAAVAGARALSRGSNSQTQLTNAQNTANAYFNANFPTGYLFSTNVSVNSIAATSGTYMRSVTTTASVTLPLIFLRMFKLNSSTLTATSVATRRDVNVVIVMDRSGSLQQSGACAPLIAAAVNFVSYFAEGRDNLGLITFASSSNIDAPLATTFKTNVDNVLNSINCSGATSTAQAVWQGYDQLVQLNQPGALNAIVLFTDGLPTAVTESFPILGSSTCSNKSAKTAVLTLGFNSSGAPQNPLGLYVYSEPPANDLTVLSTDHNCYFYSNQQNVGKDVSYAPLTDYWGNSLTATGYYSTTPKSNGLDPTNAQNIENFSANAADHAAMRVRSGVADPAQGNRSLSGVFIYAIGLGGSKVDPVDSVLLERMANDPVLNPNPTAAGNQGRYYYAADSSQINQCFMQVASQMLRISQ